MPSGLCATIRLRLAVEEYQTKTGAAHIGKNDSILWYCRTVEEEFFDPDVVMKIFAN